MDRYKKLTTNTLVLTIGTFSSKLLAFFLTRFYTEMLTEGQYGIVDVLIQTVNLLIPAVSLGINQAVMRFGMDGKTDRKTVFSTGIAVNLTGTLTFLMVLMPIAWTLPFTANYRQYMPLMCLYVVVSVFRQMCNQFVKAIERVRLFAFNGVFSTATTIGFDLLFLLGFGWKVEGYLLAVVCSDALSILLMLFAAKLWRYFDFRTIQKDVLRQMLRYALPLIPTTALWWVTDASDHYMVTAWLGEAANGLYAAAYKIPTIIIMLVGIFVDAWEMSILTEHDREERRKFFSDIFSLYQAVAFAAASGLILFTKVCARILMAQEFYTAWQYVPTLLIATVFSCFVTFFGTIYIVEKRSRSSLWTCALATLLNILLNLWFIPDKTVHPLALGWGAQGAALATCLSYGVAFTVRAIHTRTMIPIAWNLPRFFLSLLLITAQSVVLVAEVPLWILWEALMCAAVLALNFKSLWQGVKKVLHRG